MPSLSKERDNCARDSQCGDNERDGWQRIPPVLKRGKARAVVARRMPFENAQSRFVIRNAGQGLIQLDFYSG